MLFKTKNFLAHEIDRFRELQARVFSLQTDIAATLEAGMSEKDVTTIMMKKYRAAGCRKFLSSACGFVWRAHGSAGGLERGAFLSQAQNTGKRR